MVDSFVVVAVDEPEVAAAKAYDVVAVVELGEADEFARQRLADERELAAPFDFASGADPPNLVVGVVPRVFDPLRQGARRRR
jgi:hypothetical protein